MALVPLPFAVPLLVAAALAATSSISGRRFVDSISTATALFVTVVCALLVVQSIPAPIVYAFGGWQPQHGIVIGILFVIDPLGAGLATLVAALVTASFVFSWRYFREVKSLFHILMLAFLAAMVGFCLTGDLFNMFVLFELMGVAAFALTGYKVEETGPLQGALNFAISNSIGAFLILSGVALLYGRTGALNLAQIGHALAGRQSDGLIITAFVLITSGFFVKAAVVPFHFWLADAHAVAPTPVCVLFSGVMVELGFYAVFRIYWTVFVGTLSSHEAALRGILVAMGVVTALLGAVMCLLQQHLKRLLAFSTISHVGMFVIGAALLTPLGLAGSAMYILSHALVKGSLFLCAGILLHRFETVDLNHLHGRGRELPYTGVLFALGGLGLAALPPFGTFLGKGLIEDAAGSAGYGWVTSVLILASIGTGGAVLRAAGQVFLGWGQKKEDRSSEEGDQEESESGGPSGRTPAVMFAPALVLMLAGLAAGVIPHLGEAIEAASAQFLDQPAYVKAVLGSAVPRFVPLALEPAGVTASMVISGLVATAGAVIYALLALFPSRLPEGFRRLIALLVDALARLRAVHSGHAGDYVTWITVGVAVLGALCAFTLR
ncbi:MAG TPA: proton-conducting transporter membrane subunit [Ktedonobacterales bacterium]|nr:proton-conducting transporter membrane subunit [Ktedonobacterales bacterium]